MRKKLIALLTCIAMIIAFSPAVFADDGSDAVISPAPQADWQTAYSNYFANKIENCDFDTNSLKIAAKDINGDGIPEVFVNWRPHKLNVYTYADGKVKALLSTKKDLGNDSVTGYFKKTGNIGVYDVEKVAGQTSNFNVYKIADKGFKKTSAITRTARPTKSTVKSPHIQQRRIRLSLI